MSKINQGYGVAYLLGFQKGEGQKFDWPTFSAHTKGGTKFSRLFSRFVQSGHGRSLMGEIRHWYRWLLPAAKVRQPA